MADRVEPVRTGPIRKPGDIKMRATPFTGSSNWGGTPAEWRRRFRSPAPLSVDLPRHRRAFRRKRGGRREIESIAADPSSADPSSASPRRAPCSSLPWRCAGWLHRSMADFAGPSFSLGLDLDLDLDLSTEEEGNGGGEGLGGPPKVQPEGERSTFPGASSSECTHWSGEDEAEGGFCRRTPGEDPPDRTGPLKRLRRGTPRQPPPDLSTPRAAVRFSALDDDIEEFSSQEDCVVRGWLLLLSCYPAFYSYFLIDLVTF